MTTTAQLLDRFGGITHGSRLAPFGVTRRHLARAVDAGEVRRIRAGVFATPTVPEPVCIAAAHGGALTCATALRHHGVWVLRDDDVPHVWMGPKGRPHHDRCRCRAHYRPGRMLLGLAPVADALIHAFSCYGEEFFFAAFESAWNKRLLSVDDRARIRAALPRRSQWLVDFAHNRSESGLESTVRLRLFLIGIAVEAQVVIRSVGRVDFLIAGRLILEVDGRQHHQIGHRDMQRDAAASALGYETLRFDYAMILHDWPTVVQAIRAALGRARG